MTKPNTLTNLTPRENFLLTLLNKVIREYRSLLTHSKRSKPFKIVEILNLNHTPGETEFTLQITHKNSILKLTAAEIINSNFNLNDFNDFHAELIRQASLGKLNEFLKITIKNPKYKIISKRFDRSNHQFIFTIEDEERNRFDRDALDLSKDKILLSNMEMEDIYDVAYTNGANSILKEKTFISLAKKMKDDD